MWTLHLYYSTMHYLMQEKQKNENYGKHVTAWQCDINKASFPKIVGIKIILDVYTCLVTGNILDV